MRRNADGSIYTWLVRDKASGQEVRVDDRTFNPELHTALDAGTEAEAIAPVEPKKSKRKKDE